MRGMTVGGVARVAYEANRRYCSVVGDPVPADWDDQAKGVRAGYIEGVWFRLANPDAPASAQHDEWMRSRLADGWTYGPVKDEAAKTHPDLVPYDKLSADQRAKDSLFVGVVNGLGPYVAAAGG